MSVQTTAIYHQCSYFMRLLDAGQNLPTHAGESAVTHSPPVAIATPPPPDSQDHLTCIDAAGQQQRQRPRVKLPHPETSIRLPVIPAPKTRVSTPKRETGTIQPASSIWQDKIRRLLGTRRFAPHAPQYKFDFDELSVATKVPWNDASELPSPSISTTVFIPTSRKTDGPRGNQDWKYGTAITKEAVVDRRVSTAVSMPIADVIPASALDAKSVQGKHDKGQTGIFNQARYETEAFELDRDSAGPKKAFVSIPADVSESLRLLLMSEKILNRRLTPALEAPKSVQPETVRLSEDEEQYAEGPSDVRDPIFIRLVGLGRKKVVRLRPNLDVSICTAGHESCHSEIAVEFQDESAQDEATCLGEFAHKDPGQRSGGLECSLTIFGGENDAENTYRERYAEEIDIPEDAERSGDKSFMVLRSKDKAKADRTEYKAIEVMTKCGDTISSSQESTLGEDKDTETGSHNNEGTMTFARLVGMEDFNSDFFDMRDGLLSNRIWSNTVPPS